MVAADSAGTPWAGRHFDQNAFAGDDGSADARLLSALHQFQSASPIGSLSPVGVIDALRSSRLLIPLVATLGEPGLSASGLAVDKSAELAIVMVAGPDGRNVLPVFSSVAAMGRWNPRARPVPVDAVRVGLAAASENTELVILDPGSPTAFAVRRPAIWAIAQQEPWTPSFEDPDVAVEFARIAASESAVLEISVLNGDPASVLAGPEIIVVFTLTAGLDRVALATVTSSLQQRCAASTLITARVDSLGLRLRAIAVG
ncbi:MAG: SseB family protein [Microbacteriaceae bacterium]|nr:SseB family protein [Microbacteriaceae bacterium]